jgi:hypothetical protein
VTEVFNPDLSRSEVHELVDKFDEDEKLYKQMIDSLSERDLRWGLIMLEGLKESGYSKDKHADVIDLYELAMEFIENTENQGDRNLVVHYYHDDFCKPINHRDEISDIYRRSESMINEIPELAAYLTATFGKYIGELLTFVGVAMGGRDLLTNTMVGDLSHEIFKQILKKSPELSTNPTFMDLFINSHTILPIITGVAVAAPVAWYVGKKLEEKAVEAGASLEDRSRSKYWQEVEENKYIIFESIREGYEILKSRGPTKISEWNYFKKY